MAGVLEFFYKVKAFIAEPLSGVVAPAVLDAWIFVVGFGAIFVLISVVEYVYLRMTQRKDYYNFTESASNLVSGFIYKMADGMFIALFFGAIYVWIFNHGLRLFAGNTVTHWILCYLVGDLFFWLYHFVSHKLRYAWSAHVTHHSGVHYNFTTALRQNFLTDVLGLSLIWWAPLALIGFDPTIAFVTVELNLVFQFFLHTQVIRKMPAWIEAVFNTPSHHRVHHGSTPTQTDCNFGGTLIIWDRIFGTFVAEENAGVIKWGIAERQPKNFNVFVMLFSELGCMISDIIRYKDIRFLWKPPGWNPYAKK